MAKVRGQYRRRDLAYAGIVGKRVQLIEPSCGLPSTVVALGHGEVAMVVK